MSNVSTSKFVNIPAQVLTAVGSGFELNGLVLTKNNTLPLGIPYRFTSPDMVKSYFGALSEEYALARAYFAANTNKTRIPPAILFVNYNLAAQAGWIRGASMTVSVSDLQQISSGNLKLSFGGNMVELTGLDFSAVNAYSDVAAVIQTKLRAAGETPNFAEATVTFSSQFGAVTLTPGASDETGSIGYAVPTDTAGTDVSAVFGLQELNGAVLSPLQAEAVSLEGFMDALVKKSQNWVTFTKNWELEDAAQHQAEDLQFAAWNAAKGVSYAYLEHDMNAADLDPNSNSDFASQLAERDISGTVPNYGDVILCARVMGTVAAINFDLPGGRITLAFKTFPGAEITCDDDDDYDALTSKGYNSYVRDGSKNNLFFGYQRGTISGPYQFLDAYIDHIWLNDGMQVSVRTMIGDVNALPYNQGSYNRVLNAVKTNIDQALQAEVINIQIDLDAEQLASMSSETGVASDDLENVLYSAGWYFYAASPSAAVRAERGTPVLRFYYTDGGSIQKIDLNSTAVR